MHKGTLKKWNDDKGYGFIRRENGQADVFLHISALRPGSRRPQVGDVIQFQIEIAHDGKVRATHAVIEGLLGDSDDPGTWRIESDRLPAKIKMRESPPTIRNRISKPITRTYPLPPRKRTFLSRLAPVLVVMAGISIYDRPPRETRYDRLPSTPPDLETATAQAPEEPSFQCEGKTRCPEMTSCEEAMFYLQNCPGTKMDGDHDGIPCEDQLCGH